jgi:HSP20 family molecular chaperone IbpA
MSLLKMLDQISQSFDETLWNMPNFRYPLVNLSRTSEGKFKFEFAVAGFDESELQVEVGPNYFDVIGIPSEKPNNYVWKNFSTKPFNLRIKVPNIDAVGNPEFVNGVLSVEVGAAEAAPIRKLTIKKPV